MARDRHAADRRAAGAPAPDQIAIVVLAAMAVVLVFTGVGGSGSPVALAAGTACAGVALVLVARRSMELFVLLVLILRPSLDGLHVGGEVRATDPATALGFLFVVVGLIWWAGRLLQGRRHGPSLVGVALAAFLAAAALATLGSDAPVHSLGELARFATAILMFFVVDRLCEETGRPDRVVAAILAAAAVPVGVALVGPMVGLDRIEVKDRVERAIATFSQSNPFGHFLTITVLILAALVLVRSGRPRRLAVLAALPIGLALALTYTRLAWVAVAVGVLVMAWVSGRRWLVPAVVVALLVAIVVSPAVGHRLEQLISANAGVVGSESGLGWRIGQWRAVLELTDDNVVTGIGPDVVARQLPNQQPPHNDYLRAFVELGLVGLVTFLALLAAMAGLAVQSWRAAVGGKARSIALAFVGVVTAFVMGAVAANLLGQVVLLWYVFALAGAAAWVARHRAVVGAVEPSGAQRPLVAPVGS